MNNMRFLKKDKLEFWITNEKRNSFYHKTSQAKQSFDRFFNDES